MSERPDGEALLAALLAIGCSEDDIATVARLGRWSGDEGGSILDAIERALPARVIEEDDARSRAYWTDQAAETDPSVTEATRRPG